VALDESNHRLFVGCRRPPQLIVFDTTTGHQVASVPISEDTDDLSYNPAHKRVYIACGSGFLDVIQQTAPDTYRPLDRLTTREGARNSCFSPDPAAFYLAVPATTSQPAEIRVYTPR
jgi:hypothetical protein